MIRVKESSNPWWYRQLCASYLSERSRPRKRGEKYIDTKIRRRQVMHTLRMISKGRGGTIYAERLLPVIEEYLEVERTLEESIDEMYDGSMDMETVPVEWKKWEWPAWL